MALSLATDTHAGTKTVHRTVFLTSLVPCSNLLFYLLKKTNTNHKGRCFLLAVTERFAHCATACGTHPTFATIHRKVAIRQSRTGLFESLHTKNKKENHTIRYDSLFIGGDGEIRTLVRLPANAFRVRPVMTTSIRHHIFVNSFWNITAFNCAKRGRPVMSCCGARNFYTLTCKNFDRGHSLYLA